MKTGATRSRHDTRSPSPCGGESSSRSAADCQSDDARSRQPRSLVEGLPRSPRGRSRRRPGRPTRQPRSRSSIASRSTSASSRSVRFCSVAAISPPGVTESGFGIVAVGVAALVSRVFPDTIGRETGASILPALTSRLSYPVGYWNGLGILCALGLPLVLAAAIGARPRAAAGRGSRVGTSARDRHLPHVLPRSRGDRGGGRRALRGFDARRWLASGALLVTGAGSAIAVTISNGIRRSRTASSGSSKLALVLPGSPWRPRRFSPPSCPCPSPGTAARSRRLGLALPSRSSSSWRRLQLTRSGASMRSSTAECARHGARRLREGTPAERFGQRPLAVLGRRNR